MSSCVLITPYLTIRKIREYKTSTTVYFKSTDNLHVYGLLCLGRILTLTDLLIGIVIALTVTTYRQ